MMSSAIFPRDRFLWLLETQPFSDITFTVGPEKVEIKAHKNILAAASLIYIENEESIVEVPEVSSKIFEIFLKYVYLNEVELAKETVFDFLKLSEKFQMANLRIICVCFIKRLFWWPADLKVILEKPEIYEMPDVRDELLETIFLSHYNFEKVNPTYVSRGLLNTILTRNSCDVSTDDLEKLAKNWEIIHGVNFNWKELIGNTQRSPHPISQLANLILNNPRGGLHLKKKYEMKFSVNKKISLEGVWILVSRRGIKSKLDFVTVEVIREDGKILFQNNSILGKEFLEDINPDYGQVLHWFSYSGIEIKPKSVTTVAVYFNSVNFGELFPVKTPIFVEENVEFKIHSSDSCINSISFSK